MNRGTLHEIEHTYQPDYTNKGIYNGKNFNNLLIVYYIYQQHGKIEANEKRLTV